MPKNNSLKYPAGALARPDYQPGNYLFADDLQTGQSYLLQRLRRHNRMLHGSGVICGMTVVAANDPSHPWGVHVCPGYAISPSGDEIVLPSRELLDISESLWMNFTSAGLPGFAYVGIAYDEEFVKPVPEPAVACQCDETAYLPTRVQDSHQLSVSWITPEQVKSGFRMCDAEVAPCPPCPESPYLWLARIDLPASVGNAIVATDIINL